MTDQTEKKKIKKFKKTEIKETEQVKVLKPKHPGPAPSFRIIVGSYEHTLLCLSLILYSEGEIFTPIFYFTPHTQSIRCLARSKRYLASGANDEHIRLYDLQKRKELGTLIHHNGNVTVLRFFGSKWLLSGASDGKICIWRTKDWEVLAELKGHHKSINDISLHHSGRLALSVSSDKTLHLWNLMTAKKASVLRFSSTPLKVAWTPEGTHYIIGFDKQFTIYEAESAKLVREVEFSSVLQHLEIIETKEKDGEMKNWLVTSHNNGSIVFRSLKDLQTDLKEEEIEKFELTAHAIRVKQFSALTESNVTYLCSISSDGRIVVWNLQTRQETAVYKSNDRLNCCLLLPDDVEQYDTVKRSHQDTDVASDYSEAESEAEQVIKPMKKKKKTKVNVELD